MKLWSASRYLFVYFGQGKGSIGPLQKLFGGKYGTTGSSIGEKFIEADIIAADEEIVHFCLRSSQPLTAASMR